MELKCLECSEACLRGQKVRDGGWQSGVQYRQLGRQVIEVEERMPKATVVYLIIEAGAISTWLHTVTLKEVINIIINIIYVLLLCQKPVD